MENLTLIGKVTKSHGLKGHVRMFIEEAFWDDFQEIDVLFLKLKGKEIPYFVEELGGELPNVIVKLEDVSSRESADQLANCEVWGRDQDLSNTEEEFLVENTDFGFLKGYALHDTELGLIGKIDEILYMPTQEMAVLEYNNKEVLIPLVDAYITSLDDKKQLVVMNLPTGLLDL